MVLSGTYCSNFKVRIKSGEVRTMVAMFSLVQWFHRELTARTSKFELKVTKCERWSRSPRWFGGSVNRWWFERRQNFRVLDVREEREECECLRERREEREERESLRERREGNESCAACCFLIPANSFSVFLSFFFNLGIQFYPHVPI